MAEEQNEQIQEDTNKQEKKDLEIPIPNINKKTIVIALAVILLAALAYQFKHLFVVATVNKEPITSVKYVRELNNQAGQQILDNMVSQKLVEQEAKKQGVSVSQEEINNEIADIEEQLSGVPGGDLQTVLESRGMTRDDLADQIEFQLLLEKLLADQVEVTEEEIDNFIAQNEASFGEEGVTDEDRNQIRERLKSQKVQQNTSQLISKLKEEANINYFLQ